MASQKRPRGFTLVEIMAVVAIIGVLSTVALPELGRASLRARAAERRAIMTSIAQSVSDLTLNLGKVPDGGMLGNWNPAGLPTTAKRHFDITAAGWNQLALMVDGDTYYSYYFLVDPTGGTDPVTGAQVPSLDVKALGDLDGDGITSQKQISYVGLGQSYVLKTEIPADGAEDQGTF